MSENIQVQEADKYVPTEHEGTIEPNFYCRAWRSSAQEYCTNRAGKGTDHVGVGRCKFHGGATPVKHGLYSKINRYDSVGGTLGQLYEKYQKGDQDPLDVSDDLHMMRALIEDFISDYMRFKEALYTWRVAYEADKKVSPPDLKIPSLHSAHKMIGELSKMVDREKKRKEANAISLRELFRLMAAMAEAAKSVILDDSLNNQDKLRKLNKEWSKLTPR